jgi:hypothetical protein
MFLHFAFSAPFQLLCVAVDLHPSDRQINAYVSWLALIPLRPHIWYVAGWNIGPETGQPGKLHLSLFLAGPRSTP